MAQVLYRQCISRGILISSSINRRTKITMGKKGRNRDRDYYDSEDDLLFSPGTSPNILMMSSSYRSETFSTKSIVPPKVSPIVPRNPTQEKYITALENPNPPIILATGPAGSAKTYLCSGVAMKKLLSGAYEKIIITRPAVSTDEDIGFLPGSLEDKMLPWMIPIYDVFHKFVSPATVKSMIAKGQIEICPLAYMRGRTFDNAFIIADEMQNSTPNQMLMILTRIGENSKMVITGDIQQHDRKYYDNGLKDFSNRIIRNKNENIETIQFVADDVVRHPIIKDVLRMYNEVI